MWCPNFINHKGHEVTRRGTLWFLAYSVVSFVVKFGRYPIFHQIPTKPVVAVIIRRLYPAIHSQYASQNAKSGGNFEKHLDAASRLISVPFHLRRAERAGRARRAYRRLPRSLRRGCSRQSRANGRRPQDTKSQGAHAGTLPRPAPPGWR